MASKTDVGEFTSALSPRSWLIAGVLAAVAFVLVVKFSGLAEFQTGRFVKPVPTQRNCVVSHFAASRFLGLTHIVRPVDLLVVALVAMWLACDVARSHLCATHALALGV